MNQLNQDIEAVKKRLQIKYNVNIYMSWQIDLGIEHHSQVTEVMEKVCQYFEISQEQLVNDSRKHYELQARYFMAAYLRDYGVVNHTWQKIGVALHRDHSTIINGYTKHHDMVDTDPRYRDRYSGFIRFVESDVFTDELSQTVEIKANEQS